MSTPLGAQFSRVEEIFGAALELGEPAARRALVEARTAGEPELRREILSLLAADAAGAALFGEEQDGAGAEPAMAEPAGLTGRRLGPYLVGEEIGRGGMATVYLARRADGELDQTVAIKVLRRAGEELRARFRAERQTLVALRHPFIVAPLDAGTLEDGRPYLVLEKVDGRPLLDYCREENVGLEERLLLFEKICQAVAYAHGRLVVHRDLKPSNILVDRDGQPRLLDFGIAKLLGSPGESGGSASGGSDLTGAGGAPFTPRYASPEQVRGEPVSTASDVYSLGVVFFELLVLQPAQSPELKPSEALRSRQDLAAAEREAWARRLEGDLDAVAEQARQGDPAHRYASAEALRQDLERRRRNLPLLARSPQKLYLAGRFMRRHRWRLAIAATVLLSLVAAAVASRRAEQRAIASEAIAWRAHAEAAWVSSTLARLLAEVAGGENPREDALAVLEETEKLLRKSNGSAPEAEARLRHALALAYSGLGRREPALAHARKAAELARGTRGLGPEDLKANLELIGQLEESQP